MPAEGDAFSVEGTVSAPSPNHGPRRGLGAAGPDMIVLHYTGMASAEAALARLRDPAAEVSAHYLIDEDGRVFGLAPEDRRAWHAGRSHWDGEDDVNSRSIGIELAHPGPMRAPDAAPPPFPPAQMAALERALAAIRARWRIVPERVLGHSDVAPGRKIDPGESFDWPRLVALGHATAPPAETGRAARLLDATDPDGRRDRFLRAARAVGYGDWPVAAVLDAVRRRFHPWGARPPRPTFDPSHDDPTRVESALMTSLAERPSARS